MEATVCDVLAFHRIDRAAYERLVALGAARRPARDAVALLMWLHRVSACADAAARVPALVRDPASAARLVAEARAVLLDGGASAPTPLISCLCGEEDVRRLLVASCARRGVAEVLRGVGALVFNDRLHALPAAPSPAVQEEADDRSLFITFSKGFPLTREEIVGFFTERCGAGCVARVMMERKPPGEQPTYGRIVFRHAATAAAVLGGRPLAKLP